MNQQVKAGKMNPCPFCQQPEGCRHRFTAGTRFGTFRQLQFAAIPYDAKIVRERKGTQSVIIFYQSIDSLSHIIHNAAQL